MSDNLISRQAVLRCIKESREDIDWGQSEDGDAFLHFSAALYRTIASEECLPSAQPYTEAEIQKMQDLEQAELEKAFELGKAEALSEIVRCKDCAHFESKDYVMFCKHPDGLDSIKPESFCSYGGKKDAEIH